MIEGINQCSVSTFLKNENFHPYKMQLVQELLEDDFDRRIQFCELIMQKKEEDDDFPQKYILLMKLNFVALKV